MTSVKTQAWPSAHLVATVLIAGTYASACARDPSPASVRPAGSSATAVATAASASTSAPSTTTPPAALPGAAPVASSAWPPYLERLARQGDLYARVGDQVVAAPAADIAVLRSYPSSASKGPLDNRGQRLTILTAKQRFAPSEEVRVVHVHEATLPGVELYVMGPKAIYGEYVDGVLASPAAAAPLSAYDGAVIQSPGVDTNYEVSVHRLRPGKHTIQWRFATLSGPELLASNVLELEVR
jgi:hypothetical protein